MRFGSVAETVLRESRVPVLTVNPSIEMPDSLDLRSIVCAIEPDGDAAGTLRYAVGLAEKLGSRLTVVGIAADGKDSEIREWISTVCANIDESAKQRCELEQIVRSGDVIGQVLAEADDANANLLVIGISHDLFADGSLGERTTEIVNRAHCPVITVPHAK